ncbi:hypothetical protein GOP47_0015468 [Adiantum capillus-veneris]|uniref:40S ribosomal protein S3 n=1 Tax=Adiantum capillus-veneris TaxID=13818 RepID=A0A9D4UK23_ADICA|nr:hypothetical protein GOP47_0015468 [Adiantum capillus-veneris]
MASTQISKKRKFVADGVFYAVLNEVLTRELAEDGYSGVERFNFPEDTVELLQKKLTIESGAKGCEVIASGKLRAQRAKSMKFKDGYMISSGHPVNLYIDSAVRHVLLRQGVLGIKVKIMLDWDPKGKQGPSIPLPDNVIIHNPKDEEEIVPKSVVGKEEPVHEIQVA